MAKVTVEKARELGFCFGVRRAVRIIEDAAKKHGHILSIGPVVHNRAVVDRLASLGIEVVESIDVPDGAVVAIPSHGVPPVVLMELQSRGLKVIDATCPTVRRAQRAARRLADSGFGVVIFGDAGHPEVKGLLGWAGDKAVATMDARMAAEANLGSRLGIIAQTTQSLVKFSEFVALLLGITGPQVKEVRIINTLCHKTRQRQDAALELARRSDLMIVVGGRNSANTRRLAEVCSPVVETRLIETADELESGWFEGKRHIGITAGASTPESTVDEVVARLQEMTEGS